MHAIERETSPHILRRGNRLIVRTFKTSDDSAYCEQEAMSSAKYHAEKLAEVAASEAEESRPDMYQD